MTDSLIVTQPENGGPYTLNRPMTRAEMLDALHACQNGEASCLYTLKVFEAHIDMVAQEDVIVLDELTQEP